MQKRIVVDHTKCTGCAMCAQVCSLAKTGVFNPAASRIRIIDWEDTGVTVPILCEHCAEPVCLPACPEGAISKDPETGLVSIAPELCVNCRICRTVCPYAGPVYSVPEKRVVLCDTCGGEPECVKVCPTEAIVFEECTGGAEERRLLAMCEARKNLLKRASEG